MNRRDIALHYFDENKDFMNKYVPAQIERNRKGDVHINVTDKDGNPVKNVKIVIKQKSHAFRYGANIFMLDEFETKDDFVEWSFRMADKYFPLNRLIINDYHVFEQAYRENRSQYYMQIERLMNNGITHLDSIGMQFHSFFGKDAEKDIAKTRYNPIYIYEVLNKYAQLGKKIQITEMTIPAYSDSSEDEEIQAELIKNLYSVFFSHPAMEAIIYWNVVDGYAAFAPQGDMTSGENVYYGGVRRFDLSEKPASKVIKDLFAKEWHTETEETTDENGKAKLRGFYGEYEMEIHTPDKTIKSDISISENRNGFIDVTI